MTTTSSKPKKRAVPEKARAKRITRDGLLSGMLESEDGRSYLSMIRAAKKTSLDLMAAVTPPGSFLEILLKEVKNKTDLPPEIALGVFVSQLSSLLAQNGVTVAWYDDTSHSSHMDMWLLVMAPSAAGKTLLRKLVSKVLGFSVNELPEPGSGSAFLNALSEQGGISLWNRDEYGQLIKQIKDGGPLGPLRGYLLQAYDHETLEINTLKNGQTIIEHPVLSIFGSTVDTTFKSCVDAEMLSDGLLARHLFLIASRRAMKVSRYRLEQVIVRLSAHKATIALRANLSQETEYIIGPEASELYDELWKDLANSIGNSIDPAYFRRTTWAVSKYAVIYHLLIGKTGKIIDADALRWAWRMIQLHIQYAREALVLCDPGFATRFDKIIGWIEEQAKTGEDIRSSTFTRALLRQFGRDLKNMHEARQLLDVVANNPKS